MNEQLLLRLPHRQFVFTLPKVLRVFFRHDKRLHGEISRLIYGLVRDFTTAAAGRPHPHRRSRGLPELRTFARWNPHWHGLFLEGGFDREGRFVHVPTVDLAKMSACFRQRVIAFFLERKLLNERLAKNMVEWTHSGSQWTHRSAFPAGSAKTREALAQYIVRPPVSLQNLLVDEGGTDTVVYRAAYSDYFHTDTKVFPAVEFLVEVLQHLPDSRRRLIRTYGLYSSRARGTPRPAGALARREGGPASPTWSVWLPRAGSATIHPRSRTARAVRIRPRSRAAPWTTAVSAKKRRESGPA